MDSDFGMCSNDMIFSELIHALHEYVLWIWTTTMNYNVGYAYVFLWALLCMSVGMTLHLHIAQVDLSRGYGLVSLWYEVMWIHVCIVWIVTMNDSTYEHKILFFFRYGLIMYSLNVHDDLYTWKTIFSTKCLYYACFKDFLA